MLAECVGVAAAAKLGLWRYSTKRTRARERGGEGGKVSLLFLSLALFGSLVFFLHVG